MSDDATTTTALRALHAARVGPDVVRPLDWQAIERMRSSAAPAGAAPLLGNRKASGQAAVAPTGGEPSATAGSIEAPRAGQARGQTRGHRTALFRLRRASQRLSIHRRHYGCGMPLGREVDLVVRQRPTGPRASIGGLESCGRMWECVACSTRLLARRAGGIVAATAEHRASGGGTLLLTLTQRRPREHRVEGDESGTVAWAGPPTLQRALDVYRQAWARARRQLHRRIGRDYVRALEVTWGPGGWHLHAHLLVFVERPLTDEEIRAWRDELAATWASAYDDAPEWRPSLERGVDLRESSAARYLTKLGLEVASSGATKKGRRGARYSMPETLEIADNPRHRLQRDAATAWREYVATMTGVRRLVYGQRLSRDIREREQPDDAERIGTLPSRAFREIRRRMDWLDALLAAAESGALATLPDELQRLGASARLADELRAHAEARERARIEHAARAERTWNEVVVPMMGWLQN